MSSYKTVSKPKKKSRSKTKMKPRHASKRKSYAGLIAFLVVLVVIVGAYGVAGFFFSQHFLPGTTLNNSDVSMMTLSQARDTLVNSSKQYRLTLVEQDFKREVIAGDDVGLIAHVSDGFDKMLDVQSGFAWAVNIFKDQTYTLEEGTITYEYDDDMLGDIIDKLECVDPQYPIKVKDAEIVLLDGKFTIVPESVGNIAHKDELTEKIKNAIIAQESTLDLEKEGLYDMPNVYADDPELIAKQALYEELNDVVITLKFGKKDVVIDANVFSNWITATKKSNDTYALSVKDDKLKEYVKKLAETYDTYDKTKIFNSHSGNVVEITTGDYGWKLDQEAAVKKLKELILAKKTVTVDLTGGGEKSVEWWDRMAVGYDAEGKDDYGTTYAEVSIAEQHMWMYQDGVVVLETDVVTGNPNLGNDTPQGAFRIRYHQANAILRGPGYATPVAYWMVFADDVGFHDATWQPYFGGSLYLSNGSHGCVNMPLDKAGQLFELVYDGMPVFVY